MTGMIVHEWLAKTGGSENVLQVMRDTFPTAALQCLWNDAPARFDPAGVTETWLARTPLRRSKAIALPFMPLTWRHLGTSDADWVLTSSHVFAHHAQFSGTARQAPKYVYAYTPARYVWHPELDARGHGLLARIVSKPLQRIDRRRAGEAESVAAISDFVRKRVECDWRRDAEVIYPPVDVAAIVDFSDDELSDAEKALLEDLPDSFVLGASRFIPYKRLEIAIQVGVAADMPIVLAGEGPSLSELEKRAAEHPGRVTFVLSPSTALLRALYRRAAVYVFAALEDFGIMPVEAMASGTPVIALTTGGASETVVDGISGALISGFSTHELRDAYAIAAKARPESCVEQAWKFDTGVFQTRMHRWIGVS